MNNGWFGGLGVVGVGCESGTGKNDNCMSFISSGFLRQTTDITQPWTETHFTLSLYTSWSSISLL